MNLRGYRLATKIPRNLDKAEKAQNLWTENVLRVRFVMRNQVPAVEWE